MTTQVTLDPQQAVGCLLSGGLVAVPTETVYGLAAVVSDEAAVRRVFAAKGRPVDHPLIVHVDSLETAQRYGDFGETALKLAHFFWPGPLTLVVERTPLVPDVVTGGRDTVAIRIPDHEMTRELISRCGHGLVAPSANLFGHVSPTDVSHVLADLDGRIEMVLDGGPCRIGVESTIVDCAGALQVLRPGAISDREIEECAGTAVSPTTGPSRAAGMLRSHYAPEARVILVRTRTEGETRLRELERAGSRATLIGSGIPATEYAAGLYRLLREADTRHFDTVVAILPDGAGIAAAIRDRLTKAAADAAGSGA